MQRGSVYSDVCCTPTLLRTRNFFNSIDVKWYKYCRLYSIVCITEYEGSL